MIKLETRLPAILAVCFTIAVLSCSFVWFSAHTADMVEKSTRFYLESNARSQAAIFYTKITNQINLLVLASQYWEEIDLKNPHAIVARVKEMGLLHNFVRVAVAGPDGKLINSDGEIMADISHSGFFKLIMSKGETVISNVVHKDVQFGECLYIGIPIRQGEKVAGVMYGQFSLSLLSNLIEAVGFQETCTSLLLSGDGTILARSAHDELVPARIANFFDLGSRWGLHGKTLLATVMQKLREGQTCTIPYMSGLRIRLAMLTPVGFNDWYYAIVIPHDVIYRQSKALTMNLIVVTIAISIAFLTLFVTIMRLLYHSAAVERSNARFRMVSDQMKVIVFDYDFQKGHLDLTGDIHFISKSLRESYASKDIMSVFAPILHENDTSVLSELSALRTNTELSVTREIRLLCADGKYYWYRMTGSVSRNKDGKPLRFVGNLVDVEDEVTKQKQLKEKAEIDSLSGLLNKAAFTSYVSELLASSNDDNRYAFYLIDLDNFKNVNFTLGHSVGDRVLSDVAKKLCTVFSEHDFVARVGGDEFAAFLRLSGSGLPIGPKLIEAKAKAICALISEVYSDGKNEVKITASVGVASYPKNGRTFEELYRNADSELYCSKNSGKNQYNICG